MTEISSTACDRLLVAFAPVSSVLRRAFPSSRSLKISPSCATEMCVRPATTGPRVGSSRSSSGVDDVVPDEVLARAFASRLESANRSKTSSLYTSV